MARVKGGGGEEEQGFKRKAAPQKGKGEGGRRGGGVCGSCLCPLWGRAGEGKAVQEGALEKRKEKT